MLVTVNVIKDMPYVVKRDGSQSPSINGTENWGFRKEEIRKD